MNLLDRLALALITTYQRHLSPRKGFCWAHRVQHGGPSCSEYARQTVIAQGLWSTLWRCRQRLRACQVAARTLMADREDAEERRKRRRDIALDCLPDACPNACDGSGCLPDACSLHVKFGRPDKTTGPPRAQTG
jgi:putative component of membrane protein insertase Oxa1/YidC/SpoIIIJ protein YidD